MTVKYLEQQFHQLEAGIVSGKIIAETRFELPKNCLVNELYDLTFKESLALFEHSIKNFIAGKYRLTDQKSLITSRGMNIYYRKDIEKIKNIDLSEDPDEISRKVRATSMPGFEPPFTLINGEKYYIIPAKQFSNLK